MQAHQKILLRLAISINFHGKTWNNLNVLWMQSSDNLWDSWVAWLYIVHLVRQRRMQHSKTSVNNLASLRGCATITGWWWPIEQDNAGDHK